MKELIVATKNKGKIKEFEEIFAQKGIVVQSLLDYPMVPDIEETGTTFAENAALKAEEMAKFFKKPVIADDSGLIVDALDGRPGVYSARYAGLEKSAAKNNEKVLKELEGVPQEKRTARFFCAIAVAFPDGETRIFEGSCEGVIAEKPVGENGFGYDPIFYIPEFGKTMAQLPSETKNQISHRAKAIKKLAEQWDWLFPSRK